MYHALLFDLDGTLIDSLADIGASVNHVRGRFGLPPLDPPEIGAAIGDGVATLLQRTVPVEGPEPARLYREHHVEHCLDRTVLYPRVAESLERLAKRVPLAVVTNKPTDIAVRVLRGLGVASHFRACIGGDGPAGRKPAPGPVLRALESVACPAWFALMVGDSPGDMVSGRAAGTGTCAVSWGFRTLETIRAGGVDHEVGRFEELEALAAGAPGAPASVHAALGSETFHRLARAFYARIDGDARLRAMFPKDLTEAIERQALFLIQFFGGPTDYAERRGAPRLRMRHAPFRIDAAARDAWLENMMAAMEEVGIPEPSRGVMRRYFAHTAEHLRNA